MTRYKSVCSLVQPGYKGFFFSLSRPHATSLIFFIGCYVILKVGKSSDMIYVGFSFLTGVCKLYIPASLISLLLPLGHLCFQKPKRCPGFLFSFSPDGQFSA